MPLSTWRPGTSARCGSSRGSRSWLSSSASAATAGDTSSRTASQTSQTYVPDVPSHMLAVSHRRPCPSNQTFEEYLYEGFLTNARHQLSAFTRRVRKKVGDLAPGELLALAPDPLIGGCRACRQRREDAGDHGDDHPRRHRQRVAPCKEGTGHRRHRGHRGRLLRRREGAKMNPAYLQASCTWCQMTSFPRARPTPAARRSTDHRAHHEVRRPTRMGG